MIFALELCPKTFNFSLFSLFALINHYNSYFRINSYVPSEFSIEGENVAQCFLMCSAVLLNVTYDVI